MKLLFLAFATVLAVTFAYHDPAKPHRAADGFRNNYPHPQKSGFWRWKWDQLRDGLPANPEELLRVGGLSVLTDESLYVLKHGETRVLR